MSHIAFVGWERDTVPMIKIFWSLAVLMWLTPAVGLAHTRWFADPGVVPLTSTEPTALYLTGLGLTAALLLGVGWWLHQHNIWRLPALAPTAPRAYDRAAATFAMVCGAFFLIAGTHGYLFSPNQTIALGVSPLFVTGQIIIGLAFLLGIATRTAALALALLWALAWPQVGMVASLENCWVLSTALFIAVMGNDYFSLLGVSFLRQPLARFKPYALSCLRLGTGLALLVLGFSEKILAPELGLSFLAQHQWNFMALLGLPYSDYLFVLSAGVVESLIGLFFILGILTRLTALVAVVIFAIPLFILGPVELAGHLPHFAAIMLLLLFGSGGKFLVVKRYADAEWMRRW